MSSPNPTPALDPEMKERFDRTFRRAFELVDSLSTPSERNGAPRGWWERRRFRKAEALAQECVALCQPPANTQAGEEGGNEPPGSRGEMVGKSPSDAPGRIAWLLGKLRHAAGDLPGALEHFAQAAAARCNQADFYRDWSTAAMAAGLGEEAERLARSAVDLAPERDDLKVHYTWALLLAGHPKRALGVVANVCKRDPNNEGARHAIEAVRKALSGASDP